MLVLALLVFFLFNTSVFGENSTEVDFESDQNEHEEQEKIKNGRTYLFKASKVINGEEPTYRNIMQYRDKNDFEPERLMFGDRFESMKSGKRNYLRMERFKNAYSSHLIDPEWTFNSMNQFVEVPEIANEFYYNMEEQIEEFENVSTIRLVFEKAITENNVLIFDLFPLNETDEELVLDAELHIYRFSEINETDSQQTNKHQTDEIIRLYQLINLNTTDENVTQNPDLHKLLNVIYVSSSYSGWQVFKVKNVIQSWLTTNPNLGFLLTCTDSFDSPIELNIGRKYNQKYQPILIIYIKKKNQRNHTNIPHLSKPKPNPNLFNFKTTNRLPLNPSGCNKQIWYVSFQELGWNNFILAPDGFMAFQCRGSCISAIASPTTNHGLLKHLFHSFVYVKRPCCVPDTYKSIIIMFLDRFQNVVIKNYDDMIVDSCACR